MINLFPYLSADSLVRSTSPFKKSFWFLILFTFLLIGCHPYVPVKEMHFFVKDGIDHSPINQAEIVIKVPGQSPIELVTDAYGRASIKANKLKINPDLLSECTLEWSADVVQGSQSALVKDKTTLSKYLHNYDLYLTDTVAHPEGTSPYPVGPVADMHYHISMRVHNYFGEWLYPKPTDNVTPFNLTWYKSYKKLKILNPDSRNGHDLVKVNHHSTDGLKIQELTLLEGHIHSYDKSGSNKLTQYTQATHPHLLEGNVQLAYDAISPFEQATSKTGRNRLAGNLFVTGARPKWMQRIGQVNTETYRMTHWKNFNLEYNTITQQDTSFNHYNWKFLQVGDTLKKGIPTIVLVTEGSHVLQDTIFPNFVNFNIGRRDLELNKALLEKILTLKYSSSSIHDTNKYKLKREFIINHLDPAQRIMGSKITLQDPKSAYNEAIDLLQHAPLDSFVQITLEDELRNNIEKLKRLDPPICMVTISHLAYNGMTGHSVAWDQGGFINNLVARRNYGLRVSEDKQYKKQWEGAFYSIPGVNRFGRVVIDSLTSKTNGHRILIDLKHSAPSSRQFFLDSIMTPRADLPLRDTIFPICSHCGVNGFPRMYSSPFVNDYNIARAPFVHYLYPFAINLYDDEISQICRYNGIIGIPLEQRILGSYLNKIEEISPKIYKSGKMDYSKKQNIKRWTYVKRYIKSLYRYEPELLRSAMAYTTNTMGVRTGRISNPPNFRHRFKANKDVLDVIYKDYKSVEPFLYNVFHVIDHSQKDPSIAWKHICIGSDLDGLVDPIDICPTASQYPKLKARLEQFIPIFLRLRYDMNQDDNEKINIENDYFGPGKITIGTALDYLFYESLYEFTAKRMLK